MTPYYADDSVTLYHGDCREVTEWLAADVLVTDPPYGRGWRQGRSKARGLNSDAHEGITGDADTTTRDVALGIWGSRPGVMFGDLMLPPPAGCKQVLVYLKPSNAGTRGAMAGWRRDAEAIYLIGNWPSDLRATRSSVVATRAPSQGNPSSPQGLYGHPHAKPLDVMSALIAVTDGLVADPFTGSGSTLVAAKRMGRRAVGVEIEERYCEVAASRLSQEVLNFEVVS